MTWCEADSCECYIPECAEHGCMGRTGPCEYCGSGSCETCMNTGLRYPEKAYPQPPANGKAGTQ